MDDTSNKNDCDERWMRFRYSDDKRQQENHHVVIYFFHYLLSLFDSIAFSLGVFVQLLIQYNILDQSCTDFTPDMYWKVRSSNAWYIRILRMLLPVVETVLIDIGLLP